MAITHYDGNWEANAYDKLFEQNFFMNEGGYDLTDDVLRTLKKDKVPDSLITKLKRLKDQQFDSKVAFSTALNKIISEEETIRFQDLLFKQARNEPPDLPLMVTAKYYIPKKLENGFVRKDTKTLYRDPWILRCGSEDEGNLFEYKVRRILPSEVLIEQLGDDSRRREARSIFLGGAASLLDTGKIYSWKSSQLLYDAVNPPRLPLDDVAPPTNDGKPLKTSEARKALLGKVEFAPVEDQP